MEMYIFGHVSTFYINIYVKFQHTSSIKHIDDGCAKPKQVNSAPARVCNVIQDGNFDGEHKMLACMEQVVSTTTTTHTLKKETGTAFYHGINFVRHLRHFN